MTQDEIGVMLNLRATLSEYEHFMTELSTMIERGVDVPPCGSAKFPMRDKLYTQVRDLVLGKSAMEAKQPIDIMTELGEILASPSPLPKVGDRVCWAANRKRKGVVTGEAMDGSGKLLVKWDDGLTIGLEPNELLHYDGK